MTGEGLIYFGNGRPPNLVVGEYFSVFCLKAGKDGYSFLPHQLRLVFLDDRFSTTLLNFCHYTHNLHTSLPFFFATDIGPR